MYGEINVIEVMDRAERVRDWQARQRRNAEWAALKQWWNAEAKVLAATNEIDLQAAHTRRSHTARLYQAELQRAWPKWAKARQDRNARRSVSNRYRTTTDRPSTGLPGLISRVG